MFPKRFLLFLLLFCCLTIPATAAQAQVTLSWIPNTEANLTGYKIHYGISSRNYTNVIDVGLPDSINGRIQATVNELTGSTYFFAVTAYDNNGLESDYSNEIIHTPVIEGGGTDIPGDVAFSWLPNSESDLAGYRLHYGTMSRIYTETVEVGLPGPVDGRVHASVSGLSEGVTYYFAAVAYNNAGVESEYSAEIVYTVGSSPTDPPTAIDGMVTTIEDTPVSGSLLVESGSGLSVSYTVTGSPSHGTVTVEDGTGQFIYTPQPDFNGQDQFVFTAANSHGQSNKATVTITVQPTNDSPVARPASYTTTAGSPVTGSLNGLDPDGNPLSYTLVAPPTGGTVNITANGSFTYVPQSGWSGTDGFSFKVNDGTTDSNVAFVRVTVNSVNHAPTASDMAVTVSPGATVSGRLMASDPESDSLNYTLISSPVQGTVTVNNDGSFSYTASRNATESDSFTYRATDGNSSSNIATVRVVVSTQAQTFQFELVEIKVDSNWQTINLENKFVKPVVISKVTSFNDAETGEIRIRNVKSDSLEIRFQEWDYLDGHHPEETATLMVAESGSFTLGTGTMVEAGCFPISGASIYERDRILFQENMTTVPVVLTSIITYNGPDAITTRVSGINTKGFDIMMREQEGNTMEHTSETGCYIAWEPSAGTIANMRYEVATTDEVLTHVATTVNYDSEFSEPPMILAAMQTSNGNDTAVLRITEKTGAGMVVVISEEQSMDDEVQHINERGGYIAIGSWEPDMPTMEAGEINIDHNWVHVSFDHQFADPVIIARLLSKNGGQPCVVRIKNVTGNGFDIRLQEYEYLDGWHVFEKVSYLVMESGHYTLPDGTRIEAGTTTAHAPSEHTGRSFKQRFNKTPVLITSVSSFNESDTVVVRNSDITINGFNLTLQEQEANRQEHGKESVSYIAWEPSAGVVDGIRYNVARSSDSVTHETVFIEYADPFNIIPLLYADMQTADGSDTASLRVKGSYRTGFRVMVQEEQSLNEEMAHTTEIAGFISILAE